MKTSKYNDIKLGAIIGLVIPIITFFILYFVRFNHYDFIQFVSQLKLTHIFSSVISLCALPNLFFFFVFIWKNYLYSARGVLMSTIIVGFIMLLVKYAL